MDVLVVGRCNIGRIGTVNGRNYNSYQWNIAGVNVNGLKITPDNDIHYFFIDLSNGNYGYDDIVYNTNASNFNSNRGIFLAARNYNGQIRDFAKEKIYRCKLSEEGVLKRNFIPCYRKADDVRGMYDLVTDTFYTNAGKGTFEKGEDVNKCVGDLIQDNNSEYNGKYHIPIRITNSNAQSTNYNIYLDSPLARNDYIDFATQQVVRGDGTTESITLPEILALEDYTKIEVLTESTPSKIQIEYMGYIIDTTIIPTAYQEVEYIESTGTQYIDIGYMINENFKYKIDFEITDTRDSTSIWPMLIGAYGFANASDGKNYAIGYSPSAKRIAQIEGIEEYFNQRLTIELKLGETMINGNKYENTRVWNGSPYSTVCLFNVRTSNLGVPSEFASIARMYSAQIYDANTIVKDLIPCYRKSDGEIGMYDTVTETFFTNAGTGTFTKGPDVN